MVVVYPVLLDGLRSRQLVERLDCVFWDVHCEGEG
jgi:hypothetical protein